MGHADLEAQVGLLPVDETITSISSEESCSAFKYVRPPGSSTVWREQGDFIFLQKFQPSELSSVDTLWSWAQSSQNLSPVTAKYLAYGEINDLSQIVDLQWKSQYVVEVAENLITKFDVWDEDNKFGFTAFQTEVDYSTHNWDMVLTDDGKYVFVALKSSAVFGHLANIWSGTTEFRAKGVLSKKLSSHNPWLNSKEVPQAKPFYWKGSDDVALEGVISYPKGVDLKNRNLLTVIVAHGGPASYVALVPRRDTLGLEFGHSRWRPFLASYGYLVFSLNYHGDSFAMAANGVGGIEWLDVETMIEEGISQGLVDPERIGIAGYSQGGFLAALGVTRPNNKFKVGVIGAGITDWGMLAATSDVPDIEATLGGGAPWKSGEPLYLKGSPIKDVKNVTAPLLLVHGNNDARVPLTQAISFVRGVEREAKPNITPQLVVYPREDHGFEERGNCEDVLQRVLEHVDKYLK
ncbi:Alpha/Beta hydrolase protein [Gymnopilus junonius]|uniref:Dipeptidyl-peptidase V n=1 Tax=Gymnopilus junonius TaxID=109634 RepID=A0A9P5TF63_GYMJU|nr:Alpha/Beta hydrolase protein [Gymnopilus junonius]